ncbi:MAG: hypothetical protein ACRD0A_00235 [Acidimicrobiales bacterium]
MAIAALLLAAAIVATVVLLNRDRDGEVVAGGATTTQAEPTTTATSASTTTTTTTAPTTTTTPPIPPGPFVEITGIGVQDDTYAIDYTTHEFEAMMGSGFHVHFFWDTVPRAQAGLNGVPEPGTWLAWAGPIPAVDPVFLLANRPGGAAQICSLVATPEHNIADVDNDGQVDTGTGNCMLLP